MRRITRTIAEVAACAAVGTSFAYGCYVATTPTTEPTVPTSGQVPGSTFRALTTEEIDVLAEGEDGDRAWESCEINTDYAIHCPDGSWHEYSPPEPDGSTTQAGAFVTAQHRPVCTDFDKPQPADLPCLMPMDETFTVGGDGTVHDGCLIVVTTTEDSDMVCRDDTVWPS